MKNPEYKKQAGAIPKKKRFSRKRLTKQAKPSKSSPAEEFVEAHTHHEPGVLPGEEDPEYDRPV